MNDFIKGAPEAVDRADLILDLEPKAMPDNPDTISENEAWSTEETMPPASPAEKQGEAGSELPITEVTATNGVVINCTYLDHAAWNSRTNICISFHYIMVKCAPSRIGAWAYQLRLAIIHFLDYMIQYNSKHVESLHITNLKDITPPVFKGFVNYLHKIGKPPIHAFKLKSAINLAARETDVIPLLALPKIKIDRNSSTEPLYEDGVETLTNATQKIIDGIREKLKRRHAIDSVEPYTLAELQGHWEVEVTKADVLIWYKHRINNNLPIVKVQVLDRIAKCDDPQVRALRTQRDIASGLAKLYSEWTDKVEPPEDYSNRHGATRGWYHTLLDEYRVVKTFIKHGFPEKMTPESLKNEYSSTAIMGYDDCDDAVKMIIHKLSKVRSPYNKRNAENQLYMPSVDEHLELYYPTGVDMAAIALLMMLQAGWNKETVMDIDKENFEHGLTASIEDNLKLVFSEKNRGQGISVPYSDPKQILATSDSDNEYSLYNLILLAKELSAPLAMFTENLFNQAKNKHVNTLFSFIRPWSGFVRADAHPVTTIDFLNQFPTAVTQILSDHEVLDNGVRLTSASELTGRLRVTWLYYNAEQNPLSFLSQLMGHSSRDTTDESYDLSPQARARRTKRLRTALEHIVKLLRAREFSGLLCKKASEIANAKLSIFHLPYFDRPLWACADRYNPDWPGSVPLPKDVKCTSLEHCIFCSQVRILEDSLPYLMERLNHIAELLRDRSYSEFGSQLEAEEEAISLILDNWSDDDAIEEAVRYRSENTPLLPREMRELKLIFSTGDLDD